MSTSRFSTLAVLALGMVWSCATARAALPETNGTVVIEVKDEAPAEPRPLEVYLRYPGGRLANVSPSTGLLLSLHNWGGNTFEGAPNPDVLANKCDVVAIGVKYFQSGDKDDPHDPVPYDFGYRQAMDALRALHHVYQELRAAGRPFDDRRLFAAGGSGGGNVAQMANKLAPHTFACIVDLSGMASLTDDMAYGLPGGATLNARYSRDPASPAYLAPGMQEIRDLGNPAHLALLAKTGNRCKVVVIHGEEDPACLASDKRRVTDAMKAAGLDVEPHFITPADVDGKVIRNAGHSIGDRTALVVHFAGDYLVANGPKACRLTGPCDFERGEKVTFPAVGGAYVLEYKPFPAISWRH